jgi:HK97 family phage prohead protease
MEFQLTDESLNRNGYKVKTSGIDLNSFMQSPVLLWNHNTDNVIGSWANLRVEDDKLYGEPVFDEDDDLAIKIKNKVDKGLIKGCSIGFNVLEYDWDDKEECAIVTKSELFETSITAIPANKNSVKLYYKGEKLNFKTAQELKLSLDKFNPVELSVEVKPEIDIETLKNDLTSKNNEIETLNVDLNTLKENNEKISSEYNKINAQLLKLTKEYNSFKINTFLSEAKRQGQITQDEEKEYFKLAQLDLENVKKLINSKPKKNPNPLNKILSNSLHDKSGWDFHTWSKNDPTGLLDLRDNSPETYYKLYKEMLNK